MLKLKRTNSEIVNRIKAIREKDFFGFMTTDLLSYLPFKYAKQFLDKEATSKDWKVCQEVPCDEILRYLPFAWGKANGCRGLSASRSIDHFRAWLWLDKSPIEDEWLEEYILYGKPQLVVISELYGFDWRSEDDGEWRESESKKISKVARDLIIKDMLKMAEKYKKEILNG